jgi:hypothetical protein
MADDDARPQRGWFLTVMTVLFVLLAISDFAKPIVLGRSEMSSGIVEFGHRFHSLGLNLILGTLFGIVFLTYAYGIWNMRAWVLPLSIAYAFYMPYNVVLFWYQQAPGPRPIPFIVVYLAIAFAGSIGTAIYLAWHRARLS